MPRYHARVDWRDWLLAVSLALNAPLGIAYFFKGAANDIISYWFKTRFIGRGERQRELLVELNGHMYALDRNYLAAVVPLVTSYLNPAAASRGPEQNAAGEALTAVNNFLDRHTMEFPPSIRTLIRSTVRVRFVRAADSDRRSGPDRPATSPVG